MKPSGRDDRDSTGSELSIDLHKLCTRHAGVEIEGVCQIEEFVIGTAANHAVQVVKDAMFPSILERVRAAGIKTDIVKVKRRPEKERTAFLQTCNQSILICPGKVDRAITGSRLLISKISFRRSDNRAGKAVISALRRSIIQMRVAHIGKVGIGAPPGFGAGKIVVCKKAFIRIKPEITKEHAEAGNFTAVRKFGILKDQGYR